MSWFDRLKALVRRETAEAKDVLRDAEQRLDADLSRREADLHATPEEKLSRLTEEIEAAPDPFDEVRARIERMKATTPDPDPDPDPSSDPDPGPGPGAGAPAP